MAMGEVDETSVAPLLERFHQLDADGSGKLDAQDLELFARRQAKGASKAGVHASARAGESGLV